MRLQKHARTLALASMLALTVAGVPIAGMRAHAQDNGHPTDNGVRCSFQNPRNGEFLFFLPGETITLTDGLGYTYTLRCADDGHWVIDARTVAPPGTVKPLPIAPLPASMAIG